MKHLINFIVLCVIVLYVGIPEVNAKNKTQKASNIYIGLQGGYSSLLGSVSPMKVLGDMGGGLHAGYEGKINNMLLRAGIEASYLSSRCETAITVGDVIIEDSRLTRAVMHYDMQSPLNESQKFVFYGLSLMVGYSGNSFNGKESSGGFYLLGGFKIMGVKDIRSDVSLKYETTATYTRYIDDYEDMPNHYYTVQNESNKINFNLKGSVVVFASFELGYEINLPRCDKLKIGVFADVGLTDLTDNTIVSTAVPNPDNASQLLLQSYYKSKDMSGVYVVPFLTGLRLSYSFNVTGKRDCHSNNCHCYKY